eukprot:gene5468-5869_t
MSDFQTVKSRRGNQPTQTIKYADQHQQLTEMGFDSASITKALETSQGNLEAATAILLGEEHHDQIPPVQSKPAEEYIEKVVESSKSSNRGNKNDRNNNSKHSQNHTNSTTNTASATSNKLNKEESIKDQHHRMMATYKVAKCREGINHDKRMCIYWHSLSDRRRNPFEYTYSCFDCPSMASTGECKDGDDCPHAHTMLEKMFHPELYKISVCQRTQRGDSCDRGYLCAFAHNDADLRIISPSNIPKVPPPVDWKPTKPIPDSNKLKLILERIVTILKEVGKEGAGGTEIGRKYYDKYHESMELEDENKEKYKFRDLVSLNAGVTIVPNRGGPLRYVYDESRLAAATSASATTENTNDSSNKTSDVQGLNTVRERLVDIIKSAGSEGVLGSDLPKKYFDLYGEKLDAVVDESGSKMKLKDILSAQSRITVQMLKLQPKYVYEGDATPVTTTAPVVASKPTTVSYSSIVGASKEATTSHVNTSSAPAVTSSHNAAPTTTTTHTTPAPVAAQPVPTTTTSAPASAPAPTPAPAPAPVEKPAPASTPASNVVVTGKSYSSVAAKLKAAVAPAPAPVAAPIAPVVEQPKPVVVEVPVSNPIPTVSSSASVSSNSSNAAVSHHHEEAVAAIVDDGAPSAEDPIFTEDNQTSNLDNRLEPSSATAFVPSSSVPEPITYQSAFGYGSVPAVNPSDNTLGSDDNHLIRKSAPEPLMGAPGLTKIHSSSLDNSSSLVPSNAIADFHERLNLAQSQITTLQQTINKLTSDLHSKNQDYEGQTAQLRNVMQRLAEAENKTNNSDEHFKHQLKSKTEELAIKNRDMNKIEHDVRELRELRKADLNQFFINLSQIEDAINAMKCKDDGNNNDVSKIRPEEIQELLQFRKALRTFIGSLKIQLKQKFDVLTMTSQSKPLEIESNSITSSNTTAQSAVPRNIYAGVNGYDANYYTFNGRTDTFNAATATQAQYVPYTPSQVQVDPGLCALPGCRNPGHFTCAGCQKVSYCGADHQRLHWGHHSLSCHP